MQKTVEDKILAAIKRAPKGTIFFTESFVHIANAKAASKALQRLVAANKIIRIATGMFLRPKESELLGTVLPGAEDIAHAIAKRDNARIVPTGVYALNILGLSPQVPMNAVYLTDGAARFVKVGKRTIKFKKVTPKNLAAKGAVSSMVIQALRTIGKEKVTDGEIKKILEMLEKEDPENIYHDIKVAPEWIRQIMRKALNDQYAGK